MESLENTDSVAVAHTAMVQIENTGDTKINSPLISEPNGAVTMLSPDQVEIKDSAEQPSIADDGDIAPEDSDRESLMTLVGEQLPTEGRMPMMEAPSHPEGASIHRLAVDGPHPDTAEIIRQVEFYFGDENLPHDTHLLSFAGSSGDGWVSLNRILGFAKMRRFKPKPKAKAALRESTFLEVDEKLQYVRRRTPLNLPVRASPTQQSEETRVAKVLIEKPWLSKGMLKPTGFEEGFTEGPLKPEEYERERKLFDPEEAFTIRIENAVARYMSKRKMHQDNLNVFTKFLTFGGFDGSPRQFTGGFSEADLEDYTKDDIMQMKASLRD